MALVASDLNHPDYAGATNPDSRLACKFYSRPVKMEFDSQTAGRPIFKDVDYVQIFVPGDSTSILDTPAREDHKKRFPLQWAHYQNKHGGDAREIGTPLAQWPRITPAQVEELRALKFYTVEAIAHASDQNIQHIGMIAGMSPYALRDHAIRFLNVAAGDSVAASAEAKAKELEEKNKSLEERLAALESMLSAKQEAEPEKRKPGRPKKD